MDTGGFYDVLNMRASLQRAGESQPWRRQAFSPRNTLDIEWDSWSIWAFPEHVRQTKDLFVSTLGPVMIKAGKNTTHAVIPVVEFVEKEKRNDFDSFRILVLSCAFGFSTYLDSGESPSIRRRVQGNS